VFFPITPSEQKRQVKEEMPKETVAEEGHHTASSQLKAKGQKCQKSRV